MLFILQVLIYVCLLGVALIMVKNIVDKSDMKIMKENQLLVAEINDIIHQINQRRRVDRANLKAEIDKIKSDYGTRIKKVENSLRIIKGWNTKKNKNKKS